MKTYQQKNIRLSYNRKTREQATIDVIKGCSGCEMSEAPCYAKKMARVSGIDFNQLIEQILDESKLKIQLSRYTGDWIRIGCTSDPSLDWAKTCKVAELCRESGKIPVIISKMHNPPTKTYIDRLGKTEAVVHISSSALSKIKHTKRNTITRVLQKNNNIQVVRRINTLAFREGPIADFQRKIITDLPELPICETPVRLFRSSKLMALVDPTKYHRHTSVVTGKPDNQLTAGLLIPNAYPCDSSCSPIPRPEFQDKGCPHQCVTLK